MCYCTTSVYDCYIRNFGLRFSLHGFRLVANKGQKLVWKIGTRTSRFYSTRPIFHLLIRFQIHEIASRVRKFLRLWAKNGYEKESRIRFGSRFFNEKKKSSLTRSKQRDNCSYRGGVPRENENSFQNHVKMEKRNESELAAELTRARQR